jgi:hypothetical protein
MNAFIEGRLKPFEIISVTASATDNFPRQSSGFTSKHSDLRLIDRLEAMHQQLIEVFQRDKDSQSFFESFAFVVGQVHKLAYEFELEYLLHSFDFLSERRAKWESILSKSCEEGDAIRWYIHSAILRAGPEPEQIDSALTQLVMALALMLGSAKAQEERRNASRSGADATRD